MKIKCISIKDEQDEFISSQRKGFRLSKFVQAKLGEYIKAMREYKEFVEENNEKKTE